MAIPKNRYLFWLTALVTVVACVPTLAAPSVPTIDPNAIGTMIVQTANAASTQTSAAMPTLTPTVLTPTPRATETPEPTATATVIFRFFTLTPIPSSQPTSGGGGSGGTSSKPYACEILSVNPPNGTTYNTRVDFDAKWKVKNIGKNVWDKNSVDYRYLSGNKFHKVAGYDLSKTVNVGETIELIVDMLSPKNPGNYTTNWTMQAGDEQFCTLSLTIVVR